MVLSTLIKDSYIDLPNISLPLTHKDIFTDQDYEVISTMDIPATGLVTKNIAWAPPAHTEKNQEKKYRDVSLMGFITDKSIQRELQQHFVDTYHKDILDSPIPVGVGKRIIAISLITFSGNTPWHREGFCDKRFSREDEQIWHTNMPRTRHNFAINYPLYTKDAGNTKVEFAKMSDNIIQIEKELTQNMLNNKSNHEEKDGVKISVALDQILDEQKWKNDINIVGTKYKYDNPYIINLSSYHKVTTTGATRLSLRYMASPTYRWKDIEKLYNAGELIKNA